MNGVPTPYVNMESNGTQAWKPLGQPEATVIVYLNYLPGPCADVHNFVARNNLNVNLHFVSPQSPAPSFVDGVPFVHDTQSNLHYRGTTAILAFLETLVTPYQKQFDVLFQDTQPKAEDLPARFRGGNASRNRYSARAAGQGPLVSPPVCEQRQDMSAGSHWPSPLLQ
jgi:hypothetical protein